MMKEASGRAPSPRELYVLLFSGVILYVLLWASRVLHISLIESAGLIVFLGCLGVSVFLLVRYRRESIEVCPPTGALRLGIVAQTRTWQPLEYFDLPLRSFRHVLLTGLTGSGKSTLLRRWIEEIVRLGHVFLLVDFKGERGDFDEILRIVKKGNVRDRLQIFDLSKPKECITINLLTVFREVEETVGFITALFFDKDAHPYFKTEAERFLRYCFELLDRSKVERSFVQLQEIFYNGDSRSALLASAKKGSESPEPFQLYFEGEFNLLSARERSERFSGFLALLSSFTSEPLRRIFNPEGPSELQLSRVFTENIPVIIRVPGEAYGDLSARIVQGFMKALPVLLARRREETNRKDYFVILDEGCSYASETMSDLCKKAGSAGVKLLVTRMSDADFDCVGVGFLGKMLSAFSVFFCFQTNDPDTRETLARLSMTIDDVKFTKKISAGEETGDASLRDVQRFTIHPSSFGRLKVGECFVIIPSLSVFKKVRISPPEPSAFEAKENVA